MSFLTLNDYVYLNIYPTDPNRVNVYNGFSVVHS